MTRPRLKGQAQDLLLNHLCTSCAVDQLQQTLQDMSLDESTHRHSRNSVITETDPCTRLLRFLLTSTSNLKTTRRFFNSATFTLYPSKCSLKPQRFQEFMFVTPTAITILELVRAQNLELYIGSDEVTLMRFAEFKRHLMDFTRLHLESPHQNSCTKFEIILRTMAPQIRELECPATVLTYMSFIPQYPVMNLERLRLTHLFGTDSVEPQCIFAHNVKRLHLNEVRGRQLPDFESYDFDQIEQHTLEELNVQASSVNVSDKMTKFVDKLRLEMPRLRSVEMSMTEVYKSRDFETSFVEWTTERFYRFFSFYQRASGQLQRLVIKVSVFKVLQNDEEPIIDSIRLLQQIPDFANATFNEEAAIGEEFAHLDYRNAGFWMSWQFTAFSALSGSFMPVADNS